MLLQQLVFPEKQKLRLIDWNVKLMNKQIDDLVKKFNNENNIAGGRIAAAVKEYMDEFTDLLVKKVESEIQTEKKDIEKVISFMSECENQKEYVSRHIYPVLKDKSYSIIRKEKDDSSVINRINDGISSIKKNNDAIIGRFPSRINVGYVYAKVNLFELIEFDQTPKHVITLMDKNGNIRQLNYYLVWSDEAMKQVKKIWKLSRLYKSEEPLAFIPYARRLFAIEVDVEELLSNDKIQIVSADFKFDDNELTNKILLNKELVWNVKIDEPEGIDPKTSPIGKVVHWKYTFSELLDNQYVVPKALQWPTMKVDFSKIQEVEYDFESEYKGKFEKITIYKTDCNEYAEHEIFECNYNRERLNYQPRLRSLADINYEIKKFDLPSYIQEIQVELNPISNLKELGKIPSNMAFFEKGRFGYKNMNNIFLYFLGDIENEMFFDYIHFVLEYLTYCYPEIGWKGVY